MYLDVFRQIHLNTPPPLPSPPPAAAAAAGGGVTHAHAFHERLCPATERVAGAGAGAGAGVGGHACARRGAHHRRRRRQRGGRSRMHTPSMNGIVLRQRGWRERGQERERGRGGGGCHACTRAHHRLRRGAGRGVTHAHAFQERLCPATGRMAGAGAGAGAGDRKSVV